LHHEISPPLPTRHEIAWNEGETKSKDEESGNYDSSSEDNWEPIVEEKGPWKADKGISDDLRVNGK